MELALLQGNAIAFLFRWIHLLAGVAWIGLLWYFNFVQGEYFKEADASSKSDAIRKLVPRALWWFRWGAMFTFISGVALLGAKQLTGYGIMVGALLGTFMFLNVWLIIWPNQKIVIASAEKAATGGEADPAAAGALGEGKTRGIKRPCPEDARRQHRAPPTSHPRGSRLSEKSSIACGTRSDHV